MQLLGGLHAARGFNRRPTETKRIVVSDRERTVMQALRQPRHARKIHVAQQSPQVPVDIFDLFQLRAGEHELDEGILNQVFGRVSLLVRQVQSPREQDFVTLGEDLFSTKFRLSRRAALIEHLGSGLPWKVLGRSPTGHASDSYNPLTVSMTVCLRVISNRKDQIR